MFGRASSSGRIPLAWSWGAHLSRATMNSKPAHQGDFSQAT